MLFVKDICRGEWESKQDLISMAVAGRLGGAYAENRVPPGETLVAQCVDGRCQAPAGCSPAAVIVHDAVECPSARGIPCRIGLSPGIPGCAEVLDGFPLRECDTVRRPASSEFDAVVGGRLPREARGGLGETLAIAGLDGARVVVAMPDCRDSALEAARLLAGRCTVTVIDSPSLPVLSALYGTCPTVVHLGDCRRGYLHSLAMYHTSVPGRRLVERVPGERYVPPTMDALVEILRNI